MTAYVHIGASKTGTTTIQNFMAKNYEILKEKGFLYPKSLAAWGYNHCDLFYICRYLQTKDESLKHYYDLLENFKKEVNENKDKIFVFSSEWFEVATVADQLKKILNKVGFDDIKIIVYIRNQADRMVSWSSQDVKNNTFFIFYKKPEDIHSFNYKIICESYINTFSKENLIVKLFDKNEFYEGDLIKDFLHILGIKLDDSFIIPPNQNETLDLIGFELGERINLHYPNQRWPHNFRDGLTPFMNSLQSKDPSLKFMPKKEIYESYITYFEESNEWVRKEFFPHKERLFPKKDLSTYKENYELKEMKPEYWDMIASFIVDFAKDRKNIIDNKDKKIQELNTQVSNLNLNVSNLQNENSSLKQILSSQEHKAKTLKLSFLEEKVKRKELKNKILEKDLGFTHEDILQSKILNQKVKDLENLLSNIQSPQANIYTSAKLRVQNHLAYKLGQALILNSKSLKGYIRMPYVLSYIKEKHKLEQKAYNEKISKNPYLKLPSLDTYPDYAAALKEKECLTYKLGLALMKADKSWYKGGYIKFYFESKRLKKEFKERQSKK